MSIIGASLFVLAIIYVVGLGWWVTKCRPEPGAPRAEFISWAVLTPFWFLALIVGFVAIAMLFIWEGLIEPSIYNPPDD